MHTARMPLPGTEWRDLQCSIKKLTLLFSLLLPQHERSLWISLHSYHIISESSCLDPGFSPVQRGSGFLAHQCCYSVVAAGKWLVMMSSKQS